MSNESYKGEVQVAHKVKKGYLSHEGRDAGYRVVPLVEVLVDVSEDQRVAEVADDELLDVGLGAEVVVAERVQGLLNPLVDGLHVCGAEDGLCV